MRGWETIVTGTLPTVKSTSDHPMRGWEEELAALADEIKASDHPMRV